MIRINEFINGKFILSKNDIELYRTAYKIIILPNMISNKLFLPLCDTELGFINCNERNIKNGYGKGILFIWNRCKEECYETLDIGPLQNYKLWDINSFITVLIPPLVFTMIGWMGPACEGWVYGNWFEKMGIKVNYIGTNPDPQKAPINYKLPDKPIYLYKLPDMGLNLAGNKFNPNYEDAALFKDAYHINRLSIKFNNIPNLYICFQPNLYLDFDNTNTPIYFCPTEQSSRIMIHGVKNMKFVHHYFGAEEMYKNAHPEIMVKTHKSNRLFLPHSYLFDGILERGFIIKNTNHSFEQRQIFCGFMGNKGEIGSDSKKVDYICEHTYDDRFNCLTTAERYITFNKYQGYHNFEEYIQFLGNCKFGVNIGSFSDPNQRTFQIPACGAILIQKWYPELIELGFRDGINCFTFKDEKDLEKLLYDIKYMYRDMDFEEIRKNGIKNAMNHSSEQNSIRFLKFILEKEL